MSGPVVAVTVLFTSAVKVPQPSLPQPAFHTEHGLQLRVGSVDRRVVEVSVLGYFHHIHVVCLVLGPAALLYGVRLFAR